MLYVTYGPAFKISLTYLQSALNLLDKDPWLKAVK